MTMAFKYQVLLCPRPKDVLLVTFNHLDSIKGFIQDSPTVIHQVDETFRQLTDVSPPPACHLPATALVLSQLSDPADSLVTVTGSKLDTLREHSEIPQLPIL